MATIPLQKARAVRTISGNPPQILTLPEAASLAAKIGEFVYLSGGYVTEITSNSPAAILGIMATDGNEGASDGLHNCKVIIANSDTIFELNKVTGADAALATLVTDVGIPFGLYRDTTDSQVHAVPCNVYWFDPVFMCIDHSSFDTLGDTGGRLLCMVLGMKRQLFSTS